jgi:hypothetical protein
LAISFPSRQAINIENLTGLAYGDHLAGDDGANTGGNDRLYGNGSVDTLYAAATIRSMAAAAAPNSMADDAATYFDAGTAVHVSLQRRYYGNMTMRTGRTEAPPLIKLQAWTRTNPTPVAATGT